MYTIYIYYKFIIYSKNVSQFIQKKKVNVKFILKLKKNNYMMTETIRKSIPRALILYTTCDIKTNNNIYK